MLVWGFFMLYNYKKNQYPQITYKQAIKHCKYWAEQIRAYGLDLLTTNWGAAVGVSDQLAYPLDMICRSGSQLQDIQIFMQYILCWRRRPRPHRQSLVKKATRAN